MVDTEIRLIVFSAAKDGEALYSQQKQDQELTVAQIMNSLLPKRSLVSRLVNCNSILFSRFWIIFTIIILNSFSGRLPISSPLLFGLVAIYHVPLPAEYFSAFSSCYIAVFGVAFPYSGSLWFLFIVEVPHCGLGWTSGLSRFPG